MNIFISGDSISFSVMEITKIKLKDYIQCYYIRSVFIEENKDIINSVLLMPELDVIVGLNVFS